MPDPFRDPRDADAEPTADARGRADDAGEAVSGADAGAAPASRDAAAVGSDADPGSGGPIPGDADRPPAEDVDLDPAVIGEAAESTGATGATGATEPTEAAEPPEPTEAPRGAADPPRDPIEARAYQRGRLWVGIGGIGSILVLQWFGVAVGFPGLVNRSLAGLGAWGGLLAAGTLAGLAVLVQFPFDVLGRRIERAWGQLAGGHDHGHGLDAAPTPGADDRAWRRSLLGGAVRWIIAAAIGGLVLGLVHANDPERWLAWTILVVGLMCGLAFALPIAPGPTATLPADRADWEIATRGHLHRLGLGWPRLRWYDHGERSLAGGWHGLGPLARLWIARSIWDVPPPIAAGLIAREIGHADRGDRAFGVVASAGWIAAGLALSAIASDHLTGDPPLSAAGLVVITAAVMSTWSWLGLFVWPALGRAQVLAADRFLLRAGLSREDALRVLDVLARRNRPDEHLPRAVAFVFHPIPPMEVRRAALAGDPAPDRVAATATVGDAEAEADPEASAAAAADHAPADTPRDSA